MPPLDEITFQFLADIEIADELFHYRVSLDALRTFTSYNTRCKGIEDKFWEICVQNNSFQPYLDIYPNGAHTAEVRERMQYVDDASWQQACETDTLQSYDDYLTKFPNGAHVEDAYWKKACKINTEQSYNDYINKYPEGKYVDEAERKIHEIIVSGLIAGAEAKKQQIIQEILKDPNRYSLPYLKSYWHITERDLREEFVRLYPDKGPAVLRGWDLPEPNIVMDQTPERIPHGLTEVYFWGVPGSGKTCALGAILGAAFRLGVYTPRVGENGFGYMSYLTRAFTPKARQSVIHLPPATQLDSTQYLPLTLNETRFDHWGMHIIPHNLAIIDLSGDIFRCFAKVAQGKPFSSPAEESVYNTVCNYLQDTRNPKYHFFVLDGNPTNNAQHNDLQIVADYFNERRIFNKKTCDISLIVTKCDTLSPNRADWVACAERLVNDSFRALADQLKYIVGPQGLGLTGGTLDVIPLSLGDVFFQQLCLFDPQPANVLVNRLITY